MDKKKSANINLSFMNILPLELIFNIFFGGIFLLYWVVAFITLYHLTRFGIGVQPKRFAAIFLLGAVVLFCVSIFTYTQVDTSSLLNSLS